MAKTQTQEPDDDVHQLDPGDRLRRRGVYLLPNLITTGALFAGFFAIVAGMSGNFVAAALAIYSAFVLDTLDGRVARWTRSESEFGAEYDSLSDMVAFGVAPALVAFTWALADLGQMGWVVAFIYMACAGLRLARFNTKGDNTTFTGLASPSAAAIIASAVWIWSTPGEAAGLVASVGMAAITAVVGLLMVSQFTYFSPIRPWSCCSVLAPTRCPVRRCTCGIATVAGTARWEPCPNSRTNQETRHADQTPTRHPALRDHARARLSFSTSVHAGIADRRRRGGNGNAGRFLGGGIAQRMAVGARSDAR